MSTQIQDLIVKIGANIEEALEALDKVGSRAQRLGASVTRVGKQLTVGLSLPIAGLGVAAGKAFIDFESSFAGIRKTMDLTEGEFQRLAQSNRDLAKTIPVSVDELNRIGELAGQLGIRGVDNVLKFEETIAKLAVTTDLTADAGALAFAQIANVTQLPQDQIDRLGSVVVGLGNNFATVESKIVEFTQRIAGAGQIAGLSVAEIAGIGTAFASLGIEAEAGGTSIQKVLLSMVEAVSQGGDSLGVLARTAGMSVEEFRRAFQEDAAGTFIRFVEGLGAQGDRAISTLDQLGLADQRITRAFLAAAGAGDLLSRAVARARDEFEQNNALTEEAAKRFETAQSRLTKFWNRINDVSITIGAAFVPLFTAALDAVQPLIDVVGRAADWFARLPTPIRVVVGVLGTLAAAVGPVLVAIGTMASAIGAATPVLSALGGALVTVTGVLSGPVLLAIGAVGAAVTGAILIWRRWGEQIALTVRATVAVIQEHLAPVGEFIRALFRGIVAAAGWFHRNAIKPIAGFVREAIGFLVDRLGTAVSFVARMLARGLRIVSPELARALDSVVDFVADVRAKMAELAADTGESAGETAEAIEEVGKAVTKAVTNVNTGGPAGPPAWLEDARKAATALTDALRVNARMQELLGGEFDLNRAQADAYRRAVESLVRAGVPLDAQVPGLGLKLRDLADRYLDLQAGIKEVEQQERELTEAIRMAERAVAATVTPAQEYERTIRALDAALAAGRITQDQYNAAVQRAKDELNGVDDAMRQFRSLIEESLTPTERYAEVMRQLRLLLAEGKINQEQFARASQQAAQILEEGRPKIETLGDAMRRVGDQGLDAIADFAMGSRDAIRNFVQDALRQLARLAVRMLAFRLISGLATGGASEFTGFGVGVGIPGMAEGGPIRARMPVIVGERGPELIVPRSPGNVVPNDQLRGMLSTGPSVDEVIAGVLERVGPPPGPMPPEVAATHDWYRRLFSAAVIDARERGVRFG